MTRQTQQGSFEREAKAAGQQKCPVKESATVPRSRKQDETTPTISKVLESFLVDQEQRLARKTLSHYRSVIQLLQHSLNSYAHNGLDATETALYERRCEAEGGKCLEFCDVFGPEHILGNLHEFLNYFMVRKVMAGKGLLKAAGTVTKKLAQWLHQKGYASADDAADARELGAEAARNLPAGEELAARLNDFADNAMRDEPTEIQEGHFSITQVGRDRIWVESFLEGSKLGPIRLPPDIAACCQPGWRISGMVGRFGRAWGIVEVWNVYPL